VALHHDGTRCVLENLSGQGTLVAGQPMEHGELLDGAILQLGQWRALYREQGSGGAGERTHSGRHTAVQSRQAEEEGLPPAQLRVKQGTTEFGTPPTARTWGECGCSRRSYR
jgi:hypothetical protein